MQCFQFPKSHESSETMINFLLNEVGPSCQIASYSFKTTLKFYFLVVKFSSSSITDFPVAQTVKNLPLMQETRVQSLGWEVPLEKEMQSTTVFLPGELQGQRSLAGHSP